jgi:hypothetical protein
MNVSEEGGIDVGALEKIARTAISMAEQGQAGGFVFLPDVEGFREQWKDHLESDMGLLWSPTNVEELSEKELITLSDEHTCVVIDKNGRVIASRATLSASVQNASAIHRENRNVELLTSLLNAVAIMANSNGSITLYKNGRQLACI